MLLGVLAPVIFGDFTEPEIGDLWIVTTITATSDVEAIQATLTVTKRSPKSEDQVISFSKKLTRIESMVASGVWSAIMPATIEDILYVDQSVVDAELVTDFGTSKITLLMQHEEPNEDAA